MIDPEEDDDTAYAITPKGRKIVADIVRRAYSGEMLESIAASYDLEVFDLQVLLVMDAMDADYRSTR